MTRRKRSRGFKPSYRDNYFQTDSYNNALFLAMRDDIMQVALSRFKWVNLPPTCDARYLEWTLIHEGCATIAHPKSDPSCVLSLKAVQQGERNMYDNPRAWRAVGATGKTDFGCDWGNGVFIWDNETRYPVLSKINIWARELADIIRAKQINRFHMRMPVIISGASEHQFDMQNILKNISNGEPAIITTDGIENINVRVWNTGVEFLGETLTSEYENTWNIIYKELGIPSMPFKSERRVEAEVNSYKRQNQLAALSPLDMRRVAAKKYCERFGDSLADGEFYPVWNNDLITDNYELVHKFDTYLQSDGGDASDDSIWGG